MDPLSILIDVAAGWCAWSLGHNLGHRWWHEEMRRGMETFYAHGERQHHVVYDRHAETELQRSLDPNEDFISFPLLIVAPAGLLFVAGFGYLRGWIHALPFALGLYFFMVLDHQIHIVFHKKEKLSGVLGWFQRLHLVHHATHNRNFFFMSGIVWDLLLGTVSTRTPVATEESATA
jgi:hypothetical protein